MPVLAQQGGLRLIGILAVDRMIAELETILQPRTVLERMSGRTGAGHTQSVIEAIRQSAFAGIGPGNKKYQEYSKRYKAILAKAGRTGKPWLHGIKPEHTGHMLARKRFSTALGTDTRGTSASSMYFVWSAATPAMGKYAEAHQEGLRGMPQRTWMHADNTQISKAIVDAAILAMDSLILQFEMEITIPI